jgi:hypothetical protein
MQTDSIRDRKKHAHRDSIRDRQDMQTETHSKTETNADRPI